MEIKLLDGNNQRVLLNSSKERREFLNLNFALWPVVGRNTLQFTAKTIRIVVWCFNYSSKRAKEAGKILACVAFEGIIVEYDVSKALFSGADTEVCIPKLLIALTHLDVSYLKGVWQGLEELASSVHLSVASFLGAADFFVENHFELNILEQARVAEMIMFAASVAGAFATIEFLHADLAFKVP